MERNYIALLDDGHDYIEYRYTSKHRLHSNANMQDCKDQYKKDHGFKAFRRIYWDRFTAQRDDTEY